MDFFTGQILPLAFGYAPKQTAMCQGQTIPITQNQALFALLGISFGGDGKLNFGLPNTGGRTIIGTTTATSMGAAAGEANHTLALNEIPLHAHNLNAVTGQTGGSSPQGNLPGTATSAAYGAASSFTNLTGGTVANSPGGQSHNNMQPSTPINFAIVLYGIFPSRS